MATHGTLGYQGSSSHKFIRLVNQLFVQPVIPQDYFAFAVYIPTPDVNANYNALNARLTRRFAKGFSVDALYRWAKSIDTLSNEGPGAVTNQTFPQDLSEERGPSDFDVRHNLTVSGLWDLPFFRDRKDAWGKVLGGWQIDGIVTAHTGFPWTPHTGQCVRSANSQNFVCPSRPHGILAAHSTTQVTMRSFVPAETFPVEDWSISIQIIRADC